MLREDGTGGKDTRSLSLVNNPHEKRKFVTGVSTGSLYREFIHGETWRTMDRMGGAPDSRSVGLVPFAPLRRGARRDASPRDLSGDHRWHHSEAAAHGRCGDDWDRPYGGHGHAHHHGVSFGLRESGDLAHCSGVLHLQRLHQNRPRSPHRILLHGPPGAENPRPGLRPGGHGSGPGPCHSVQYRSCRGRGLSHSPVSGGGLRKPTGRRNGWSHRSLPDPDGLPGNGRNQRHVPDGHGGEPSGG